MSDNVVVGNPLWETNNHWGVPLLLSDMQADHLDVPLCRWGRERRKSRMRGTWHFYTADAKFRTLWSRPGDMLKSGACATVECNYSVHAQTPRAAVLWATFRKRWLARYWQSQGVRVIVDLNVDAAHRELNMLGVPRGWRAYATRGSVDRLGDLNDELALAREHAGQWDVLFVVYGGGRAVETHCYRLGVTWIPEDSDTHGS